MPRVPWVKWEEGEAKFIADSIQRHRGLLTNRICAEEWLRRFHPKAYRETFGSIEDKSKAMQELRTNHRGIVEDFDAKFNRVRRTLHELSK